jgi:hypothetical protein
MSVIIGAVATLVGIILGGAVRAGESWWTRRQESAALLSALSAEIEAVTRLINHRQFIPALMEAQGKAHAMINAGHGTEPCDFVVISLKKNYFATYEASLSKIGLLDPYWADRITRFYTFAKAVSENYDPSSPFQEGVSAYDVDQIIGNDLLLLHTVVVIGGHVAQHARQITPPRGLADPFGPSGEGLQPSMPVPQPRLANAAAGDAMEMQEEH